MCSIVRKKPASSTEDSFMMCTTAALCTLASWPYNVTIAMAIGAMDFYFH